MANNNNGEYTVEEYAYEEAPNELSAYDKKIINFQNKLHKSALKNSKNPGCGKHTDPEEVIPSGKLQLVVVANPNGPNEHDFITSLAQSLMSKLPFTKIIIYISNYQKLDKLTTALSHLDHEIKNGLNTVEVRDWQTTPWDKNDIFETITGAEESTYLLLLSHGQEPRPGQKTKFQLNQIPSGNGITTKLIPLVGEELVELSRGFSGSKHLVVATCMCFGSRFIVPSDLHPHIHYIFQGSADECVPSSVKSLWEKYFVLIVDEDSTRGLQQDKKMPQFKTLHNAVFEMNTENDFPCDIYSCNRALLFEPREYGSSGSNGSAVSSGGRRRQKTMKKKSKKRHTRRKRN